MNNNPKVFWRGQEITGVTGVTVHVDEDDRRVKLRISGSQDILYAEMIAAGVAIKKVGE